MVSAKDGWGWRHVAAVAAVLGTCFVLANVAAQGDATTGTGVPYVRLYDQPSSRLEVILNQGDGQAFAALAQDPLLRRPEIFRAGSAEAAYRAQRPILGWVAWALSGGQEGLVPVVLVALAIVGFVGLASVMAWLLLRRGSSAKWALAVALWPGTLVTLDWTGPEALGTAAALAGFGLLEADRRRLGIASLIAAGLLRESLLLVPVAMAAHALVVQRRSWRHTAPLLLPVAVYAAWVAAVWLRLGALPSDAGRGRLAAPFTGLLQAASGWGATDAACALLLVAVGVAALAVGRHEAAGWVSGAFVLASFVFGADVWGRVEDFSRVLLPAVAFGVLVLGPALAPGKRRCSVARDPRCEVREVS